MSEPIHGYTKLREVGSGSFGKAILCKDKDGKQFIMKVIDITRMNTKERKDAMNEAKVLAGLKHPYIVSFKESWCENGQLCIVMDFADGGDLYAKIQKQKKLGQPFTEEQILRWFTQALLALKYMHDKHILHRDIKSSNFFLTTAGRLKVGDFGIAKVLESTVAFAKTTIGTPYYLSPEICKEQPYSWTSDIWSLGCVLYEMCALRVPFDAQNIKALVEKITKGPTPVIANQYSPALRALVNDMLNRDLKKRPTASEILQRDIIQNEIRRMLKEEQDKKAAEEQARREREARAGGVAPPVSSVSQAPVRSSSQVGSRSSTPLRQNAPQQPAYGALPRAPSVQPGGAGIRAATPERGREYNAPQLAGQMMVDRGYDRKPSLGVGASREPSPGVAGRGILRQPSLQAGSRGQSPKNMPPAGAQRVGAAAYAPVGGVGVGRISRSNSIEHQGPMVPSANRVVMGGDGGVANRIGTPMRSPSAEKMRMAAAQQPAAGLMAGYRR